MNLLGLLVRPDPIGKPAGPTLDETMRAHAEAAEAYAHAARSVNGDWVSVPRALLDEWRAHLRDEAAYLTALVEGYVPGADGRLQRLHTLREATEATARVRGENGVT